MQDAFFRRGLTSAQFPSEPKVHRPERVKVEIADAPVPSPEVAQLSIIPPEEEPEPVESAAAIHERERAAVRPEVSRRGEVRKDVVCLDCGLAITRMRLPAPPKPVLCGACRSTRYRDKNAAWRESGIDMDVHQPSPWPGSPKALEAFEAGAQAGLRIEQLRKEVAVLKEDEARLFGVWAERRRLNKEAHEAYWALCREEDTLYSEVVLARRRRESREEELRSLSAG